MKIPLFRVDAFSRRIFEGNPAAVCPLEEWLPDETLRAIAAENNLSETAFFVAHNNSFALRWFTPVCEVNLCGHATLAAAYVIFNRPELNLHAGKSTTIRFETRSGPLLVQREGQLLAMDFPSLPPWVCEQPPAELMKGLGSVPEWVLQVKDNYFVVFGDEEQVRNLRPNLALFATLHPAGVCVTAPGTQSDFVSRYFVPSYGIPEDPVTGSTHCSLAPYWAKRLGKDQLHARQLSARAGELWCEQTGKRVIVKGQAVLYLVGSLTI